MLLKECVHSKKKKICKPKKLLELLEIIRVTRKNKNIYSIIK